MGARRLGFAAVASNPGPLRRRECTISGIVAELSPRSPSWTPVVPVDAAMHSPSRGDEAEKYGLNGEIPALPSQACGA